VEAEMNITVAAAPTISIGVGGATAIRLTAYALAVAVHYTGYSVPAEKVLAKILVEASNAISTTAEADNLTVEEPISAQCHAMLGCGVPSAGTTRH
jgi:hypothetical protein